MRRRKEASREKGGRTVDEEKHSKINEERRRVGEITGRCCIGENNWGKSYTGRKVVIGERKERGRKREKERMKKKENIERG